MKTISRKAFLRSAAVGAAGLALMGNAGFAAEEAKGPEEFVPVVPENIAKEHDCDILVIGGGGSGICCAAQAAEYGAKVILLEKTYILGGCSLVSGGNCLTSINSKSQIERGEELDLQQECANWVHTQQFHCDAALVYAYLSNTGETADWMQEHGFALGKQKQNLFSAVSFESKKDRPGHFAMLCDIVVNAGGAVICGVTAKSLIQDEAGSVIGAYALTEDGEYEKFNAKAVVLATGGFAANKELVERFRSFDCAVKNLSSNVGEGTRMAWAIGAAIPDNVGGMMWHHTSASWENNAFEAPQCGYPRFLNYAPFVFAMTKRGERFKNEDLTTNFYAGPNFLEKLGGTAYYLVNGDMLAKLEEGGFEAIGYDRTSDSFPYSYTAPSDVDAMKSASLPAAGEGWANVREVFDAVAADGFGFKGESLQELCEVSGMDYEVLSKELAQYNEYCRKGCDEMMGKNPKYLFEYIDQGPYYAVEIRPISLGTISSLVANSHMQVLREDRSPIAGLYAVGVEAESGLYLRNYFLDGGGSGIGFAFTSGRVAAKEICKSLKLI